MEKFKRKQIVKWKASEKDMYIIVTWARGDHDNTFQGTVISSDYDGYPIGEHSRTWHEDKFEPAPAGKVFTIIT